MVRKQSIKKTVSFLVVIWILIEFFNQVYLRNKYSINDSFEWNNYAYQRNEANIDRLYKNLLALRIEEFSYEYPSYDTSSINMLLPHERENILLLINRLKDDLDPDGRIVINFQKHSRKASTVFFNNYCEVPNVKGCFCLKEKPVGAPKDINYSLEITTTSLWEKGRDDYEFHLIKFLYLNSAIKRLDVDKCYYIIDNKSFIRRSMDDDYWIIMYRRNVPSLWLFNVFRKIGL